MFTGTIFNLHLAIDITFLSSSTVAFLFNFADLRNIHLFRVLIQEDNMRKYSSSDSIGKACLETYLL